MMPEAKAKAGVPNPVEVDSNHNTTVAPSPVGVARVAEVPDYNPQRKLPNKANLNSDVTNTAETARALVEEKGGAPYRANVEAAAETVADTAAASDAIRAGAVKTSPVAAAKPQVANETLPDEVENVVAPASDSGVQS
jgi:hypothetical protein